MKTKNIKIIFIKIVAIFLILGISANAVSTKQYKTLKKELKAIKKLVVILEKRTRPPKKKKPFPKPTRNLFDNKAGYTYDCKAMEVVDDTSSTNATKLETVCDHRPLLKLKSEHGQEISFFGNSFEAKGSLSQRVIIKEDIDKNQYLHSFISLEFNDPQVIGMGINAWKGFSNNKHELDITISQYSFLVKSEDSNEFYRHYDIKYYFNYSKRVHIAFRPFIKHKAYSESRLQDAYDVRLYVGWSYYFGKKYNYAIEISPFYERMYNPKATEDGKVIDYEKAGITSPAQELLGGYMEAPGLHATVSYHW